MGLWLKQDDGSLIPLGGSGSSGGSGSGGGPHDHDEFALVEHDHDEFTHGHAEYSPVEHDHDEFAHNHDYLPLTGGTLTGGLQVDGQIQAPAGSTAYPALAISNSSTGFHTNDGGLTTALNGAWKQIVYEDLIRIRKDLHVDGTETRLRDRISMRSSSEDGSRIDYEQKTDQNKKWITSGPHESDDNSFIFEWYDSGWTRTLALWKDRARFYGDLKVDGTTTISGSRADVNLSALVAPPADHWTTYPGVWADYGMHAGTQGGYMSSMTNNGYRISDGKWKSLGVNNQVGATQIDLGPTGVFYVRVSSNWPTGSAASPPVHFTVTESGPTFRAMPSQTRSVDDVLERAETAEFPTLDDDGVATMDGHDEVPLFEVVTALLAKVKELSARIEELEGN